MNKQILKAEKRKVLGRRVKSLRAEGILPGNIYGKKVNSQAVQLGLSDFEKVFKSARETGLVELALNGEARPVLIHHVQKDPVSDSPIHVDFLQVDLREKVAANIPVELSGESPAEKQALGTVVQYINEVEVEALPADLPEKFVLDVSGLADIGQLIKVSDVAVDRKKVEIKSDPEQILVKVEPPQKIEEVAPAVAEAVPAEGAAPSKEGAAGEVAAEGGEAKAKEGETSSKEQPQ